MCWASSGATVEVGSQGQMRLVDTEQGSMAKAGKSVPKNQTRFLRERRGRQVVRITAADICPKDDRPKGVWGG